MSNNDLVQYSKVFSNLLRHRPQMFGLRLDQQGWCRVDHFIAAFMANEIYLDRQIVEYVVANNDKRRFMLSDDGLLIRATQGHSVPVDLDYQPATPPDLLYHGTAAHKINSILRSGLKRGRRHHVHLSANTDIATNVGRRHGRPVVLLVHARQMHADGYTFYCTPNGVWLVDFVPPPYIEV